MPGGHSQWLARHARQTRVELAKENWPSRIRTWINGSKVRCPAIGRRASKRSQRRVRASIAANGSGRPRPPATAHPALLGQLGADPGTPGKRTKRAVRQTQVGQGSASHELPFQLAERRQPGDHRGLQRIGGTREAERRIARQHDRRPSGRGLAVLDVVAPKRQRQHQLGDHAGPRSQHVDPFLASPHASHIRNPAPPLRHTPLHDGTRPG